MPKENQPNRIANLFFNVRLGMAINSGNDELVASLSDKLKFDEKTKQKKLVRAYEAKIYKADREGRQGDVERYTAVLNETLRQVHSPVRHS